MATKVEQSNLGFEKLFKCAKRFYCQTKTNGESANPNKKSVSEKLHNTVLERQKASIELSNPVVCKSLEVSDRKMSIEPATQTFVSDKLRDLMKKSTSKDINKILTPQAAHSEIRSGNASLQGVRNSQNLSEYCKPDMCKNYAATKTLNSDKLTEIINNSIKAAVQNLANDTNSPCLRQEQENVTPMESSCFNDTCTQHFKSSQNKENVTSGTQYSQRVISNTRPNVSGNICSIYANNGSKRSYDSHQRSPLRQPPTCCIPSSKSAASSVLCHQSVSKYKQITYPSVKRQPDKPSKSCKLCKPCKPCKPCRPLKADNRKMTGNVNIYICSEGNDAGSNKKKTSDSTCNSMTVTNASCACSSTDVCVSQRTSSSKTIRNLMEKRKNAEDITLETVCGKLRSDCECLPVQSKNDENEALCLCDMSSINPTASNETCIDATDYNLQTPNNSGSSPQGDYCTRSVRSRSSSQQEPCCTQQNFDSFNGMTSVENNSGIYVDKLKFTTGNSGRGDAVQECSCCETFSNYSDGKFNVCACCNVKDVTNLSLRNQHECYVPQNNVDYSRREDDTCKCYAYENESQYSNGRKSDIDQSVCCQNKNMSKLRVQLQNNTYCTKPCDTLRNSVCNGNNAQQTRYSNFCIMEEDETCDASSCQFPSAKPQNLNRSSTFQQNSNRFYKRDSDVRKDGADTIERQQPISNGKPDDAAAVVDDGVPTSQTDANSKRMSVAEIAKSYSNADKSTSSNMISPTPPVSPLPSVSKDKSGVHSKKSLEKQPRRSSLKWPFNKAKSFISGKNTPVESKKDKSSVGTLKSETNAPRMKPVKSSSMPKDITENSENVTEKTVNGGNSVSVTKNTTGENSSSVVKGSAEENSLMAIKSSVIAENKSEELVSKDNKTKLLSSSRLGSLIADRKNSIQSATNETARSHTDNEYQFKEPCYCGAVDADICTCQHPQCRCCNRPREDCRCDTTQDRPQEKSCKGCKQAKRVCCCYDINNQQKKYPTTLEDGGFRVCTLCCRPEKDCCCNSGTQTPRRSRSPSNSYDKTGDRYGSVCRKSQICLYCEESRDNCTCRAPIKKCSYCGLPIDVCNCRDVTATSNVCSYDGNICQCNGRAIQSSDGGDQSICVTAWKPRRDVRKYFSRNPGERDNPDCSCCNTIKPYGSDELPYQRLSVFSDVMTELQQKMSELACCNRCQRTPCCCYLHESKSYSSPTNEGRVCNTKQRKSRNRSPSCCHYLGISPCKCVTHQTSAYQVCNRCRTTPCRCRKSRSTQRKPQAKCYYCKRSPCRCETNKATTTTSKSCRCGGSPLRSQGQALSLSDRSPDRNPPVPRPRSCRCRCGSPGCGSPPRGQERPYS